MIGSSYSAYGLSNMCLVCADQNIVRQGPVIVERTISILSECKKIWPLAGRWVEALTKFSQDPKAKSVMKENSMDDGKDPIPHALPPFRTLAAAAAAASAKSESATAPPSIASSDVKPATSPAMSTSSTRSTQFAPKQHSTHDASTAYLQPPPISQPPPPQAQLQATAYDTPMGNTAQVSPQPQFSSSQRPVQNQLHLSPSQQPQQQQQSLQQQFHAGMALNNYVPVPAQPAAGPGLPLSASPMDGFALMDAYAAHDPKRSQSHGNTFAAPVIHPVPNYFPQLGPTNDGFEHELQFYIDGANNQEWSIPPEGWLNTGL